MWVLNGKNQHTCLDLWKFILLCHLAGALLTHPLLGALPPFLSCDHRFPTTCPGVNCYHKEQSYPLSVPTHRVLPFHFLLPGGLGHVGHVLVGARPPIHVETCLCVLLLWVYLSLDHFFQPVDCEAVGMLGAIPAKGQVRGRNERCRLGWAGLGWAGVV